MLEYIINLHLPVLIYFFSYIIILFIRISYCQSKKKLMKYLIILIFATMFLEFLYNKKFKMLVWFIVLSPYLAIILGLTVIILFLFFFKKKKNETIGQRINQFKNIFKIFNSIRENNSISIINQMRTLINV